MGALGTIQSQASQTPRYTFQEYTSTFFTQNWQALGMYLIFRPSSCISSPFSVSGRCKWLSWSADQYVHQNSCLGIENDAWSLERHLWFLSFPWFAYPCSCNFLQLVFLPIPFLFDTTKIHIEGLRPGESVQLTPLMLFLYFLLESLPPLFFSAFQFLHSLFITLVAYCIISTDCLCPNIVLCFFLDHLDCFSELVIPILN